MRYGNEFNRRSALRSLAAGLTTISYISNPVVAASDQIETTVLSGTERRNTLEAAYRSDKFNHICKELESKQYEGKKWSSTRKDAVCTEVVAENLASYRFVVLPFKTGGGRALQANLLWFDRKVTNTELPKVLGHVAQRRDERGMVGSSASTLNTDWSIETYQVESRTLVTRQGAIADSGGIGTNEYLDPGDGGGDEGCYIETVTCDSWDWSCMLQAAAAVAGTAPSCAACLADPTKLSCGLCLFFLSAGASTVADCGNDGSFWGDECQTDLVWLSKDEFYDKSWLSWPDDCYYQ